MQANRGFGEAVVSPRSRMLISRVVGVVVIAYVLLDAAPHGASSPWLELGELCGLLLLGVAAFGRIWCTAFVAGRKNEELVTDGPYSVVRNPLYLFSFLGVVGFGLAVENPLLALLLGLSFAAYYRFVVRAEERFLAQRFGAVYAAYCEATPRWWPRLRNWHEPRTVLVDVRRLRSGILDAMWFVWAFLLSEALELLRQYA